VLATNVSLPLSPENIFKKLKIKLKIKKNKYKDPVIYYLIYGFGKERTKKKERKKERENTKNIRSFANEPTRQLSFGQQGQQAHLVLTTPLSFTYRLLISSLLKLATPSWVQLTHSISFSLPLFHFLPN
jgi:hypothetical protein